MAATPERPRSHYFDNETILKEIHRSKLSYCSAVSEEYTEYDIHTDSLDDVDWAQAKSNAARRLGVPRSQVTEEHCIVRLYTCDHLPTEIRTNPNLKILRFHPFRHYIRRDGRWIEVLRSHWRGSFEGGYFSVDHGQLTQTLTKALVKLVQRYATRGNWRGYSWNADMQGHAVLNLVEAALKFDERQSMNPFGYYTRVVQNAFRSVLQSEETHLMIRDAVMEAHAYSARFDTLAQRDIERFTIENGTAPVRVVYSTSDVQDAEESVLDEDKEELESEFAD